MQNSISVNYFLLFHTFAVRGRAYEKAQKNFFNAEIDI